MRWRENLVWSLEESSIIVTVRGGEEGRGMETEDEEFS